MTRASKRLGKQTEDHFFEVCNMMQKAGRFPHWLKGFRRSTKLEDQMGIDAWAETDVGDIYVQIKTGIQAALYHSRRRNRKHISVVVSPVTRKTQLIYLEIVRKIREERKKILAESLCPEEFEFIMEIELMLARR